MRKLQMRDWNSSWWFLFQHSHREEQQPQEAQTLPAEQVRRRAARVRVVHPRVVHRHKVEREDRAVEAVAQLAASPKQDLGIWIVQQLEKL
jgi:hypothetical protein